jgi:glycine betaine/proline transport system permease protein
MNLREQRSLPLGIRIGVVAFVVAVLWFCVSRLFADPVAQWVGIIPRLPLGGLLESGIDFMTHSLGPQLSSATGLIDGLYRGLNKALLSIPPIVVGFIVSFTIWRTAGLGSGVFSVLALLLIGNLDLWPQTMSTLALMGTSVVLALAVGIPVGILAAHSRILESALTPALDFAQTMPPFVYLIPAVIMFGIGPVPGILATVIYAAPVAIRLTSVGIQQVDQQVVEAGEAFGCGPMQLLFKIKLPLAFPVIAAAVNQTIMYSLGMVIIASMIGAGGLGAEVLRGITRLQFGVGFEAGLAVVLVAVLLDRFGRGLARMLEVTKPSSLIDEKPTKVGNLPG